MQCWDQLMGDNLDWVEFFLNFGNFTKSSWKTTITFFHSFFVFNFNFFYFTSRFGKTEHFNQHLQQHQRKIQVLKISIFCNLWNQLKELDILINTEHINQLLQRYQWKIQVFTSQYSIISQVNAKNCIFLSTLNISTNFFNDINGKFNSLHFSFVWSLKSDQRTGFSNQH